MVITNNAHVRSQIYWNRRARTAGLWYQLLRARELDWFACRFLLGPIAAYLFSASALWPRGSASRNRPKRFVWPCTIHRRRPTEIMLDIVVTIIGMRSRMLHRVFFFIINGWIKTQCRRGVASYILSIYRNIMRCNRFARITDT